MQKTRRYEEACDFLRENKLRYSRQRMVVINELFFNEEDKKHFKINDLLQSIEKNYSNVSISGASLTNILKGLCSSGHIREVYINKPYYDINTTPHVHFYHDGKDELIDAHDEGYVDYLLSNVKVPQGYKVKDLSCVINVDTDYNTEENI